MEFRCVIALPEDVATGHRERSHFGNLFGAANGEAHRDNLQLLLPAWDHLQTLPDSAKGKNRPWCSAAWCRAYRLRACRFQPRAEVQPVFRWKYLIRSLWLRLQE